MNNVVDIDPRLKERALALYNDTFADDDFETRLTTVYIVVPSKDNGRIGVAIGCADGDIIRFSLRPDFAMQLGEMLCGEALKSAAKGGV